MVIQINFDSGLKDNKFYTTDLSINDDEFRFNKSLF